MSVPIVNCSIVFFVSSSILLVTTRLVFPNPTILGDTARVKISVDSPIGKGLLGKKTGDSVEIEIPSGNVKFEILEISR